jgi:hypothetical protein
VLAFSDKFSHRIILNTFKNKPLLNVELLGSFICGCCYKDNWCSAQHLLRTGRSSRYFNFNLKGLRTLLTKPLKIRFDFEFLQGKHVLRLRGFRNSPASVFSLCFFSFPMFFSILFFIFFFIFFSFFRLILFSLFKLH